MRPLTGFEENYLIDELGNIFSLRNKHGIRKKPKAGVSKQNSLNKPWVAKISLKNKCKTIGYFSNINDAVNAYKDQVLKLNDSYKYAY